jgi:hypothetical protein
MRFLLFVKFESFTAGISLQEISPKDKEKYERNSQKLRFFSSETTRCGRDLRLFALLGKRAAGLALLNPVDYTGNKVFLRKKRLGRKVYVCQFLFGETGTVEFDCSG